MRLSVSLVFLSVCLPSLLLAGCGQEDGHAADGGGVDGGGLQGTQQQYVEPFCGTSTGAACAVDADCVEAGCSGQLCQAAAAEPAVTTCEYRDCYDAARHNKRCGCVAGACAWS